MYEFGSFRLLLTQNLREGSSVFPVLCIKLQIHKIIRHKAFFEKWSKPARRTQKAPNMDPNWGKISKILSVYACSFFLEYKSSSSFQTFCKKRKWRKELVLHLLNEKSLSQSDYLILQHRIFPKQLT